MVGLLGGASCTQLVHRLTRFYLHCLCGRVIVSAADWFVAGLAVSGVAHGAILYVQLGKRRTPAKRTKMPVSLVGKDYLFFVFFVLAMHASVNIVYIHEPQTSPIARSS